MRYVTLLLCCLVTFGLGFFLGSKPPIVELRSGPNGTLYKVNLSDGKTTWVVGKDEIEVGPSNSVLSLGSPEEPSAHAINLAKSTKSFSSSYENESVIKDRLNGMGKSVSRIAGWFAEEIDPNNFRVRFKFSRYQGGKDTDHIFGFLVNTKEEIVVQTSGSESGDLDHEQFIDKGVVSPVR